MKKLDLKKVFYGGLAVTLAVGIGWGVHNRLRPENLITNDPETASITRRFKPVSAKDVNLSVSGEGIADSVSISASDVNYEFIHSSSSGDLSSENTSVSLEEVFVDLLKEKDIAFAYDIHLNQELEAGKAVQVTIDDLTINNPDNFMILHIKDDGEREFIEPLYVDRNKVVFETTSFSFYAGYETTPLELVCEVPANTVLKLPLTGILDVAIDWGDGTIEGGITTEKPEHQYTTAGTYTVRVAGDVQIVGTKATTVDGTNLKTHLTAIKALGDLGATRYGFFGYTNLETVKAGTGVNVSSVADMSYMFANCTSLKEVVFTPANTTNVTNMTSMFENCIALERIIVDTTTWKTTKVTSSNNMFLNNVKLVGAVGTTYNSSNINKTYARIDVDGTPGYLRQQNMYQVKIDGTAKGYATTLAQAMEIVEEDVLGEEYTITLLGKSYEKDACEVSTNKNVTINLGGYTIVSDVENLISVKGTLNVSNGVFSGKENVFAVTGTLELSEVSIKPTGSSAITLSGAADLVAEDVTIISKKSGIIAASGWTGDAKISGSSIVESTSEIGATFNGTGKVTIGDSSTSVSKTEPSFTGTTGIKVSGTLVMYDGILKGTTAALSGTISTVPTGYKVVDSTSGSYKTKYVGTGTYTVGSNTYDSLAYAIKNASSGATVTVINTATDSSTAEIPSGKTITLATGGKTVTFTKTIVNDGTLTINGSGTITTSANIPLIENNGTLTVAGSAVVSGGTYGIKANKSFNFTSGTIRGKTAAFLLNGASQAVVKSGCEVKTTSSAGYYVATVGAATYMYSGTYYANFDEAYDAAVSAGASTFTITAVADEIYDESTISIASGKTVTLDTGSSTITFKNSIAVAGTLKVAGGGIIKGDTYGINKTGSGTLRIVGVEVVGGTYGIQSNTSIYLDAGVIKGITDHTKFTGSSTSIVVQSGYTKSESEEVVRSTTYQVVSATKGNYMIGTNSYSTLSAAISAASDGDTIRLCANIEEASGATVPSGKNLKLDINNHAYRINSSSITINGGLHVYGAGIISTTSLSYMFINNGDFKLGVSQVNNKSGGIVKGNSSSATTTILSGSLNVGQYGAVNNTGGGTVIIGSKGDEFADNFNPMILGSSYAVISSNGFYFYDGTLRGITAPYSGYVIEYEQDHEEVNSTNSSGYKVADLQKVINGVIVEIDKQIYTGLAINPTIRVYDRTTLRLLTQGKEYSYSVKNNTNVGTATITLNGVGEYNGTTTRTFEILPREITFEWSEPYEFLYDGNYHLPNYTCDSGVDGEVPILDLGEEKNVGVYTVTPKLTGISGGNGKTSNYTFNPPSVTYEIYAGTSDLELSTNTITLFAGTTQKVDYTLNDETTISYSIKNPQVAKVSKLDETNRSITIEAMGAGVTTIEIIADETEGVTGSKQTLVVIVLTSSYTDGIAYYETLYEAISKASTGSKITLLEDVAEVDAVTIPSGKIYTLNMNEFDISVSGISNYISNNGTFILTNELPKEGDVPNWNVETGRTPETANLIGETLDSILKNAGTLTIRDNMLVKAKKNAIINNGTMSLNGSTFANVTSTSAVVVNNANATGRIYDGTINGQDLGIDNKGTLTIQGADGDVNIKGTIAINNTGTKTISVTSAKVNGKIYNTSTGTSTIASSTLENAGGIAIESSNGTINVNSSTINASNAVLMTGDNAIVNLNNDTITTTSSAIKTQKGTMQIYNGTTIDAEGNGVENTGATVTIRGDASVSSEKTALKSTAGTTTVNTASIEATGEDTAIYITGGTVTISDATLEAANGPMLYNTETLPITSTTISTVGDSNVDVITNSGTLTLTNVTMTTSGNAIVNEGSLILKDSTSIIGLNGVENTGTVSMGTEDNTIAATPTITVTYTAMANDGDFYWYDGVLVGRAESVYTGTDPILQDKVAITSSVSGQVKTMSLSKDTVGPEITQLITETDWTPTNATIQVIATDNIGIAGYGISETAGVEPTTWQTENVFSVTENKIYYLWVKDSGNNKSYKYITISKVCKAIWNTTGTTGSETRAVLELDGTLLFEVKNRATGANANATGNIKNYSISNAPWISRNDIVAIEISDGIQQIGEYALGNLETVKTITIGSTVTSVADTTFAKTNNYTTVSSASTAVQYNFGALFNSDRTLMYTYSNESTTQEYIIEYSVTKLAPYVFYNNDALTKLTITGNITSVGENAFEGVKGDVYYYTSSAAMREYVLANSTEAKFIPIDDYIPIIELFTLNNGVDVTNEREITFALIASDDIAVEKMLMTETFYDDSAVGSVAQNLWQTYASSGTFSLSATPDQNKTVYVWVKDAAGNISARASVTIYYDKVEISLKGQANTVQYVDTTGKNFYKYVEAVQGGYSASSELTVTVAGSVQHNVIDTYTLVYTALINSSVIETQTRTVDVIANSWNTTTYTQEDGYRYQIHSSGKYAKIVGYTGTIDSIMTIPTAIMRNGTQYTVIDIGSWIFTTTSTDNTKIVSLIIPEGVINISANAFVGCTALTNITLPKTLMKIGDRAFERTGGSAGMNLAIPDNVREIGISAFAGANIKTLEFGSELRSIRGYAFENTSNYTNSIVVSIPQNVVEIYGGVFTNRKISSIAVNAANTNYKVASDGLAIVSTAGDVLVVYRNSATAQSYTVPTTVNEILAGAFSATSSLKKIELNNTEVIGAKAFYKSGLTGIQMPASVELIGESAFESATALQVIAIHGAPEMDANVLNGTTSLKGIIFTNQSEVPSIETTTIPNSTKIYVSEKMYDEYLSDSTFASLPNIASRLDTIIELIGLASIDWNVLGEYIEAGVYMLGEKLTVEGSSSIISSITLEIDGSVDYNTPGSYTLTYKAMCDGTVLDSVTRTVIVRDTTAPTINRVETEDDWTYEKQTFTVHVSDNIQTTYYYYISKNSTKPSATDSAWQESNVFEVTENDTWYIFVRDSHGNVSEPFEVESVWVAVEKWDISENQDETLSAVIPEGRENEFIISGTGNSKDYKEEEVPWYGNSRVSGITAITVETGVTDLGKSVLANFDRANTVVISSTVATIDIATLMNTNNYTNISISGNSRFYTDGYTLYSANRKILYVHSNEYTSTYSLPTTVEEIGAGAFMNNGAISNLDISNVKKIYDKAFNGAIHVKNMYVPATIEYIGENVFAGITTGPIYYYSSSSVMINYVKEFGTEANFVMIDNVVPVVTSVKINNGDIGTQDRNVVLTVEGYDDVGITHILVEETRSPIITKVDSRWATYDNSGFYNYQLSEGNGTKTVYVWMKDAAGNISEIPASDDIVLGSYNFNLKGQQEIVMYVDETTGNYYSYNENVQGGYNVFAEGMTVAVNNPVNTKVAGTYSITYTLSYGGMVMGTYERSVSVIPNSWNSTIYTSGHYKYQKHATGNYAKIIAYTGTEATVSIPGAFVDSGVNYRVIDIGSQTTSIFSMNNVSRVTLPDTMINIGSNTFKGLTALSTIEIPESVLRIEDSAFENTGIEDAEFSDNMREICASAYANANVSSVQFGTLIRKIGTHAFMNATRIDELVIPENINVIEEGAFAGANIIEISGAATSGKYISHANDYLIGVNGSTNTLLASAIGSISGAKTISSISIYRIGKEAFMNATNLTELNIASYTEIGEGAFKGSGLTKFTVPSNVSVIEDYAFQNCTALATVVIEGAMEISENIFEGDTSLTRLVLVNSNGLVTLRGDETLEENINIYAFKNEDYKANAKWSQYAERIYPMFYLNGDAEITLEAGSTYVEEGVYIIDELFKDNGRSSIIDTLAVVITNNLNMNVTGRQTVTYKLTSRGTNVAELTRTINIKDTTPPEITKIETSDNPQAGKEAFTVYATDNGTIDGYAITQSNEVPDMNSNVWSSSNVVYATGNGTWYIWVRDIAYNYTVQAVEAGNVCNQIWDIGLETGKVFAVLTEDNVLVIRGEGATKDLSQDALPWEEYILDIVGIEVWDGVTRLGKYVLSNLEEVKEISIAATLESAAFTAFVNTNEFETVIIDPANDNFVYENSTIYSKDKSILYVHTNKDSSATITIDPNTTVIADYAFANNNSLITVNVPNGVEINDGAFYNNINLTSINGAVGDTKIGAYAFANCHKLANISLYFDIEKICSYAFSRCDTLTTLDIDSLKSLVTLEHHAFANLYNVFELTMPSSIVEITTDGNGNKNVFEGLGRNYSTNGVVYYYDSCLTMGTYAQETPDAFVDFIERDTTGPELVKVEIVNIPNGGNYPATTELQFRATFSEECDFTKGVLPVLTIKIGDGSNVELTGVPDKRFVTYTYVTTLDDSGLVAVEDFVGKVYDALGRYTDIDGANLSGREVYIRTAVKVTNSSNGDRYFAGLTSALTSTSGIAEFTMLLDDTITSTINVRSTDEYTLKMNNKKVSFTSNVSNVLISNAGKLTIKEAGTLSLSGPGQMYGVMNEGELIISDVEMKLTNTGEGVAYGIHNLADGVVHIKSGKLTATSTQNTANAYALYNEGTMYMDAGTISATSINGRTYGLYNKGEFTIITGDVLSTLIEDSTGGTAYGIYNATGKAAIGKNDESMSIDTPYIYALNEAVRSVAGTIDFYDGTLEGAMYNSINAVKVNTVAGYAVVKTITGNREYATLGMDTEGPVVTITKEPNASWTNEYVLVTMEVYDAKSGVQSLEFDGQKVELVNGVGTFKVTQNGTYTVNAKDFANNITSESVVIKNVDIIGPTIISAMQGENSADGKANIEIIAEDADSGVYGYAYNTRTDVPTSWRTIDSTVERVTLTLPINTNGNYYIFVKDTAGNVTRYASAIKVSAVDSSEPEILSISVEELSGGYVNSAMVVVNIEAEDDVGVKDILLSNELLTITEITNSKNWVPYTEKVLWKIPDEDREHTIYAWVRDAAGRRSAYGLVTTKLLSQYIGGAGENQTSFKLLYSDNNYSFDTTLDPSDVRVIVKDTSGKTTYDGSYGTNITLDGEPVIYGPIMQGSTVTNGRYYTLIVDNTMGNGTIYLALKTSAEKDKAGNGVATGIEYLVPTDVVVELDAPTINVNSTQITVSDTNGNGTGYIKIDGMTVKLSAGKIGRDDLLKDYGIELKSGMVIEASDKCANISTYTMP